MHSGAFWALFLAEIVMLAELFFTEVTQQFLSKTSSIHMPYIDGRTEIHQKVETCIIFCDMSTV